MLVCSNVLSDDLKFAGEVDKTQYELGRTHFESLQRYSKMPKYGKCWTNTLVSLQEGCKQLTELTQSRLALAYLNCFLQVYGKDPYPCDDSINVQDCTLGITESDRSSLATFFTHTQDMCYFLQAQVWHEITRNMITTLSQTTTEVMENLADAINLQKEALSNQEIIITQSMNLSHMINSSSENLYIFFNRTHQQLNLIIGIVDAISFFQKVLYGKISLINSITYYCVWVCGSLLFTSTARTKSARFSMIIFVIFNMFIDFLLYLMYIGNLMDFSYIEVSGIVLFMY